jgi:adenine-specific DNA-methyltransferase
MNRRMNSGILNYVEDSRLEVISNLPNESKILNGQYLTPASISKFMADMFSKLDMCDIQLLDPGAGAGSLLAAFCERITNERNTYNSLSITAYEIDQYLITELKNVIGIINEECNLSKIPVSINIINDDFILANTQLFQNKLLSSTRSTCKFTHAIINPPYKKLHSKSLYRKVLRQAGIETSNLYTAFLSIAIKLLKPDGELVAIIPRSFCNGPYFKPFRQLLFAESSLRHIHIFHSRESAFKDDDVLQENIIIHVVKERPVIPISDFDDEVLQRISVFDNSLEDLGIQVSTGPVVDFRLKEFIHYETVDESVPIIYPAHFNGKRINWPLTNHRKPNYIECNDSTKKWLMPSGYYVLTRRFSSKEEKRRIMPALFEPISKNSGFIGFENHLNIFHSNHKGINKDIAQGLCAYLNSTLVDLYFRQFSGHTQVNASDLRMLPYPSNEVLIKLGSLIDDPNQFLREETDDFLEALLKNEQQITKNTT